MILNVCTHLKKASVETCSKVIRRPNQANLEYTLSYMFTCHPRSKSNKLFMMHCKDVYNRIYYFIIGSPYFFIKEYKC